MTSIDEFCERDLQMGSTTPMLSHTCACLMSRPRRVRARRRAEARAARASKMAMPSGLSQTPLRQTAQRAWSNHLAGTSS